MKKSLSLKDFPEEIQKGFVSKSLSIEEVSSKIEDNFEKGLISKELYEESKEILEKGIAQVGEIRTWSDGKKYQKTPDGWVPVKESKGSSKTKEDSSENKNSQSKVKDATDHLMEMDEGTYLDALDPDSGEQKFKPGDKVSFVKDGKKVSGTVSSEEHPEYKGDNVYKITFGEDK